MLSSKIVTPRDAKMKKYSELIELIKEEFGISQAEIGRRIGLSDSQISRIKKGESEIGSSAAVLLGLEFGVNRDFLSGESDRPFATREEIIKTAIEAVPGGLLYIPRHEAEGEVLLADDRRLAMSAEWIDRLTPEPEMVLAFGVYDNSMAPLINEGDLVLIDQGRTRPVNRELYLVRMYNEYLVRRAQFTQTFSGKKNIDETEIKLVADQPGIEPIVVPANVDELDLEDFVILGMVIMVCHQF
jgi:phage repressor protein C with HTH and peptisase S24 domain